MNGWIRFRDRRSGPEYLAQEQAVRASRLKLPFSVGETDSHQMCKGANTWSKPRLRGLVLERGLVHRRAAASGVTDTSRRENGAERRKLNHGM